MSLEWRDIPPPKFRGGDPIWVDDGAAGISARSAFFGEDATGVLNATANQTELQDQQSATLLAASSEANAQASQTEQADAQGAQVATIGSAQASQTEAQDSQTATAAQVRSAQAAQTELADAQTATAAAIVSAQAGQTETQDSQSATAVLVSATGSILGNQNELPDAQSAQSAVLGQAQSSQVEAQDSQNATVSAESGPAPEAIVVLGGGGSPRRSRPEKGSYLERLLSPPPEFEPEPQEAAEIEVPIVEAAPSDPLKISRQATQASFLSLGAAIRDSQRQQLARLQAQLRQEAITAQANEAKRIEDEDEEESAIALLLAY